LFLCFFFQAEDGIRDFHVTGVQTCALPILALAGHGEAWTRCSEAFAAAAREHGVDGPTAHLVWQTIAGAGDLADERLEAYLTKRSEERRVGKECRSRWGAYHHKKKKERESG